MQKKRQRQTEREGGEEKRTPYSLKFGKTGKGVENICLNFGVRFSLPLTIFWLLFYYCGCVHSRPHLDISNISLKLVSFESTATEIARNWIKKVFLNSIFLPFYSILSCSILSNHSHMTFWPILRCLHFRFLSKMIYRKWLKFWHLYSTICSVLLLHLFTFVF